MPLSRYDVDIIFCDAALLEFLLHNQNGHIKKATKLHHVNCTLKLNTKLIDRSID